MNDIRIFSLGGNDGLAESISKHLTIPLGPVAKSTFADGEQHIQFGQNVRNTSVYLIQPTNQPDSNFTRLMLGVDAIRRASAREITAVIPYYGYARQERKSGPRTPISARVFGSILDMLGVDRILTMDLHTNAIEGFFQRATVDHLYARPVFIDFLKERFAEEIAAGNLVVVTPDAGGANRARSYSLRLLNDPYVPMIAKGREKANQISSMELIGDVVGKTCLIVDDMADTCGTLVKATNLLKERGAKSVFAAITHGLFSKDAVAKLNAATSLDKLFVTDTVASATIAAAQCDKIELVTVAPIFAEAIKRVHDGQSLSELFEV